MFIIVSETSLSQENSNKGNIYLGKGFYPYLTKIPHIYKSKGVAKRRMREWTQYSSEEVKKLRPYIVEVSPLDILGVCTRISD